MYKNFKRNFIKLTSLLTTLNTLKLFKISYIIGSKAAFFSCAQAVAPVSGLLFNRNLNIFLFLSRVFLFIFNGFNPLFTLLYHVPSSLGTAYLNTRSILLKTTIPLICIALFLINPNIVQADITIKLYCLYFAVPIIISLLNFKSIFLKCLASTFVSQAIGAILWLYTNKFDQAMYYKLIGIVWAERLLFATIMTSAFYIIKAIEKFLTAGNLALNFKNPLKNLTN